ncbi:MAG TPA: cytochrome c maturation protein CcmE [Candidatus Acidoferrum sp.]|nr:cytochrome c maturation protein CcmE [Candidatus Acidoferrum sp.]
MNPARKQKLMIVGAIVAGAAVVTGLLLYAFNEGLNAYFQPNEVAAGKAKGSHQFRLGGMVKEGSLVRQGEGTTINFITTDFCVDIPVTYTGVLPDLFREKQGVIALGKMDDKGVFQASEIVAKHDENYMPPEVKATMDAGGKNKDAGLCTSKKP